MIRPTVPADTPALLAIARGTEVFKPLELVALEEVLDDYHATNASLGHRCVTCEEQGGPVGFAYYAPAAMTDRTWYLYWIAVDKTIHVRGVGTRLLAWAEAEIAALAGRLFLIETSSLPHYELTRRFYLKHGYQLACRLDDFYADGDDLVVFRKRFLPRRAAGISAGPDRGHPAAIATAQLEGACEIRRTRRSGPGGQNRNKVETAVVLVHRPSGIGAEASERRSQAENLRMALFRLRINLALGIRRPVGRGEAPSPLWQTRCRGGRIVVSPEHDDFPAILAEALDVLEAHTLDPKPAAGQLGSTPSQLTRLLKDEPRALRLVNEGRRQRGLHPLR